jgi:hypothetical protein
MLYKIRIGNLELEVFRDNFFLISFSFVPVFKNKCDLPSTYRWPSSLSDKKQDRQRPWRGHPSLVCKFELCQ